MKTRFIITFLIAFLCYSCNNKRTETFNSFYKTGMHEKVVFEVRDDLQMKYKRIHVFHAISVENENQSFRECDNIDMSKYGYSMPDVKPKLLVKKENLETVINSDPFISKHACKTGEIIFSLTINCKSETGNFEVLKTECPEISRRLLHLFYINTKWEAARIFGKSCDCSFCIICNLINGKIVFIEELFKNSGK
ncbi:MAG: hypothetical protein V2A54_04560 [Bacteroidota bacterium]